MLTCLVNTGAGGGSFASKSFIQAVQTHAFQGDSIMSKHGKGSLSAANPSDSKVPPMNIVGSAHLPLIFPPEDKVRIVTVRVVEKLPYGFILGAAFLRKHGSIINFGNEGGFKPTPSSPWVPFLTQGEPEIIVSRKQVKGWKVHTSKSTTPELLPLSAMEPSEVTEHREEVDHREQFSAVKPPVSIEEPQELGHPDRVPSLGDSAWEDDGTLQWKLYNEKAVVVDGFISLQISAFVKGPQPQERQLVLITPTTAYDLEQGADLGTARGVQWWYPHTPLHCKMVNVTKTSVSLQRGMTIANAYALNAGDVERIKLLHEAPMMPLNEETMSDLALVPPVIPDPTKVDLTDTNMGQLNPRMKAELLDLLKLYFLCIIS